MACSVICGGCAAKNSVHRAEGSGCGARLLTLCAAAAAAGSHRTSSFHCRSQDACKYSRAMHRVVRDQWTLKGAGLLQGMHSMRVFAVHVTCMLAIECLSSQLRTGTDAYRAATAQVGTRSHRVPVPSSTLVASCHDCRQGGILCLGPCIAPLEWQCKAQHRHDRHICQSDPQLAVACGIICGTFAAETSVQRAEGNGCEARLAAHHPTAAVAVIGDIQRHQFGGIRLPVLLLQPHVLLMQLQLQ